MIYSILAACAVLASQVSAACTREMLQGAAAAYVKAQAAGQPDLPFADSLNYTENDAVTDVKKGILSQAITIDFNRSIYDTTQCATFTEITAATNKKPYVIHWRMVFTDNKITTAHSLVAKDGDWAFNAAGHLKWTKTEKWESIPEAKRDTRAVIKAAGDAYLDSWGDSKIKPPYGAPCTRLEGGSYTSGANPTTNTCTMPAFPQALKCGNRRYVIDEELGAVDIFNDFPFIDKAKPNGAPSGNFMRVEGGQLRYIHENTICTKKGCAK